MRKNFSVISELCILKGRCFLYKIKTPSGKDMWRNVVILKRMNFKIWYQGTIEWWNEMCLSRLPINKKIIRNPNSYWISCFTERTKK